MVKYKITQLITSEHPIYGPFVNRPEAKNQGLKHYFIVEFPQRPGALREFLDQALSPTDDITRFEYTKKTSADSGPALVGIQLRNKEDYEPLIERIRKVGFKFQEVNDNDTIMKYFV